MTASDPLPGDPQRLSLGELAIAWNELPDDLDEAVMEDDSDEIDTHPFDRAYAAAVEIARAAIAEGARHAGRLAALEEVAKAAQRREDTMAVIAAGSYPAATVDEGIAMMRAAYDDHHKARADLRDALAALAGLPEGEQP